MKSRHLSLDQLESFVAVADAGSVTAAAQRLGFAQPTVSQRLKRLEAQLCRTLIERGRAGASLTAEGLRLLPLARGLLRLDEQFAPAGAYRLRLGACSNIGVYVLPELLSDFERRGGELPEIRIAGNPEIARALGAGELDLALLEWWEPRPGFEDRLWREEPVVAILPADHELASYSAITVDMLQAAPLLGGEAGTGAGRLLKQLLGGDQPPPVTMTLGSTEAVKRAVAAGLGVSVVLRSAVFEEAQRPHARIAVRPLQPPLSKALHLVWRSDLPHDLPLLSHLAAFDD